VRTYEGYEELYAKEENRERVITVDASRSIEEVTQQMLTLFDEKLWALKG